MIKVIKRNNEVVEFDRSKVEIAILKAMEETDAGTDETLALKISCIIMDKYIYEEIVGLMPTVETIQDDVEALLAEHGRFDVAKKYILYRNKRAELRAQGWEMNDLQKDIFEQKYRYEKDKVIAKRV